MGAGDGIAAAILGFVGLACMFYAGYLGGELVFTKGTGVNHTAWETADEDYEAVLPVERVEENTLYRVLASGVLVVVLRQASSSTPSPQRVPMPVDRWMRERSRAMSWNVLGTVRAFVCAMVVC